MNEREDTIERIERVLNLAHKNSITVTIPRLTAERVVSMLKEQEPYISKETRLNRDEYCRVGDVLDCFDGMDMKADEVFHAVCLIEWAMSKRSVPLDQLLEDQEAKPMIENERGWNCPACGIELIGKTASGYPCDLIDLPLNFCPRCGQEVKSDA